MINEFPKIILSLLFSMIIMTAMEFLSTIPKEYSNSFNEALKTRDVAIVRKS